MKLIGKYAVNELVILNFVGGSDANDVCDAAGVEVFACDFDGTTDGIGAERGGWNCLVLRQDLPAWLAAAKDHEADVTEAKGPLEAEHYGDGNWPGVDLCEAPRGQGFYWIEL